MMRRGLDVRMSHAMDSLKRGPPGWGINTTRHRRHHHTHSCNHGGTTIVYLAPTALAAQKWYKYQQFKQLSVNIPWGKTNYHLKAVFTTPTAILWLFCRISPSKIVLTPGAFSHKIAIIDIHMYFYAIYMSNPHIPFSVGEFIKPPPLSSYKWHGKSLRCKCFDL